MITGIVSYRSARIRLDIRGNHGTNEQIEAVIDTGYNGWLTLSPALVEVLKLPWKTFQKGTLADGSEEFFEVFEAQVMWDNKIRRVPVHMSNSGPLVGMGLLKGYELKIQVRSRGKVAIKRLTR